MTLVAKILPVPADPSPSFFVPIADLVHRGGLLAVGTESSYALAASVFNPMALDRVSNAKERPSGKPLLVLIGERSQLDTLAGSVPSWFHEMINEFWPGPLTVIVPARPGLSSVLTAETGTIGIREPAPAFLRTLLRHTGPLTGTSANLSGQIPCLTAEEVEAALGHDVDLILDTGPATGNRPSTLLSVVDEPAILRAGPVSVEEIQGVLSQIGLLVPVKEAAVE
ncbi:MAG: threonylcarbamoyl-AMP synthase [Nitrospira sp. SB0677_bin_15]|nr:threonylcarbamoyl-AMP synthase [Nitrospira sp. SB0667_bin_9]MYD31735.1 threonylcarbamoyl-AMP synthase [Nitrospira sp. SB0661_bin_20]MYG40604.1 threonylcarbamoyl-AMP synthase [Nitrospira sp. SB0677_bin_15]MYH01633.1 threonylcarbamoyl-AMP synthase [Nitrospira sp. SB0675_bin_23]MYJ23386.1 threonylcarbamoyl-AMP synthase [Nitrospira sp. SB0673_bin_12]